MLLIVLISILFNYRVDVDKGKLNIIVLTRVLNHKIIYELNLGWYKCDVYYVNSI